MMFKYKPADWTGFKFTLQDVYHLASPPAEWSKLWRVTDYNSIGDYWIANPVDDPLHDRPFDTEDLLTAWATRAQAHIDALEETTKLAGEWIQGAEVSVEPGYSGSRAEILARLDTVLGNQSATQEATDEQ